MSPIELEVAYNKPDQVDYEALGIPKPTDEGYEWIKVTLFEISSVTSNTSKTSLVVSGGIDHVVNVPYKELVEVVTAANKMGIITELMMALNEIGG